MKFRVWDSETGKYREDEFSITSTGRLLEYNNRSYDWVAVSNPKRYTIERQAGQTYDGEPVFDGDVIKPANGPARAVYYREPEKQWYAGEAHGVTLDFILRPEFGAKVIGTIHVHEAESANIE